MSQKQEGKQSVCEQLNMTRSHVCIWRRSPFKSSRSRLFLWLLNESIPGGAVCGHSDDEPSKQENGTDKPSRTLYPSAGKIFSHLKRKRFNHGRIQFESLFWRDWENDSRDDCARLNNEAKLNAYSLWVLVLSDAGSWDRERDGKWSRRTDTASGGMNNRRGGGSHLRKHGRVK